MSNQAKPTADEIAEIDKRAEHALKTIGAIQLETFAGNNKLLRAKADRHILWRAYHAAIAERDELAAANKRLREALDCCSARNAADVDRIEQLEEQLASAERVVDEVGPNMDGYKNRYSYLYVAIAKHRDKYPKDGTP